MPKFTEEKRNSIWETYQRTKSYTKTAEIEKVDPRTVRKEVLERKSLLAAEDRANSEISKHGKGSREEQPNPELRRQLRANKLFEKDYPNLRVSQELKLAPEYVIKYRNEFNQMLLADLEQEIEGKKQEIASIKKNIEERQNKLEELDVDLNNVTQSVAIYQSQKADLIKEIETQKRIVQDWKNAEKRWRSKEAEARKSCSEVERCELREKLENEIAKWAVESADWKRRYELRTTELEQMKNNKQQAEKMLNQTKNELDGQERLNAALTEIIERKLRTVHLSRS